MSNSSSSFGKFLLGSLLGGVIGGVIGMLLAPRSGSETRSLIREEFAHRYHDSTDVLKEKADVLKDRASALKDRVSDMSANLEEGSRQAIHRLVEVGKGAISCVSGGGSSSNSNPAPPESES